MYHLPPSVFCSCGKRKTHLLVETMKVVSVVLHTVMPIKNKRTKSLHSFVHLPVGYSFNFKNIVRVCVKISDSVRAGVRVWVRFRLWFRAWIAWKRRKQRQSTSMSMITTPQELHTAQVSIRDWFPPRSRDSSGGRTMRKPN